MARIAGRLESSQSTKVVFLYVLYAHGQIALDENTETQKPMMFRFWFRDANSLIAPIFLTEIYC